MAKASKAWFKPLRKSYIAANYKGALTYIPFIAYLVLAAVLPVSYLGSKVLGIILAVLLWLIGYHLMTMFAKSRSKK